MGSSRNFTDKYGKAEKAYLNGNYEQAATIIDEIAEDYPEEPSVLLLRGHIYCYGFHQYELAKQQYDSVLQITNKADYVNCAHEGLETIRQLQDKSSQELGYDFEGEDLDIDNQDYNQSYRWSDQNDPDEQDNFLDEGWEKNLEFDHLDWETGNLDEDSIEDPTLQQKSPLNNSRNSNSIDSFSTSSRTYANPFDFEEEQEKPMDWEEMPETQSSKIPLVDSDDDYGATDFQEESEAPTFVVSSELQEMLSIGNEDIFEQNISANNDDYSSELSPIENSSDRRPRKKATRKNEPRNNGKKNTEDDYQLFADEDLSNAPSLALEDVAHNFTNSDLFEQQNEDVSGNLDLETVSSSIAIEDRERKSELDTNLKSGKLFPDAKFKPEVDGKQGWLAPFQNASFKQKQLIAAATTAMISAGAVFVLGLTFTPEKTNKNTALPRNALISLVTGLSTFLATGIIGQISTNHVRKYTTDLRNQFEELYKGNFTNARASIYSQDELGQLAAAFNQMAGVIYTTTSEAQRRAEERERITEDLQRQVIRLLDDVEGAARGDLTVTAEVTADVLGAVADAFNLTIQNLREIVLQVKQAALQVHQGATDSESFARNQSSDALRMAEELAVTLNSVQMLTDSIQRVADSAREAEAVARSSSATAIRGGKAVERTVEGILQIRETVSETNRKVKRLAEASQEISKIVASISNISSDINMQALNASIYAVKAGEAGRGFAIVADEVRQLAERSAKSLKDIEQIVLQIQSETGSVMVAMEEGLQQVLDVTERAEQAKGALEDIIQVSNRIDALVRSITADTVEQRENSRAVAQVMQSVELTAQETSQESQRVAGSLQNLVVIARDLLGSVERFRVESTEKQK